MQRYDMGSENNRKFPGLSTAMDILRDSSSQGPCHDEVIVSLHDVCMLKGGQIKFVFFACIIIIIRTIPLTDNTFIRTGERMS